MPGWFFYVLIILAQILHPHQTDPIEDLQRFFSQETWEHWQFNIVALVFALIWVGAWIYTQKDKKE